MVYATGNFLYPRLTESWYNDSIFKTGSGRMAIHTMIDLQSWYNDSIFKTESGRMAI